MKIVNESPDTRPGPYYVSVVDGARVSLLLGPYELHADALDNVERARKHACKVSERAWFYAFGTVRSDGERRPGIFNGEIGLIEIRPAETVLETCEKCQKFHEGPCTEVM